MLHDMIVMCNIKDAIMKYDELKAKIWRFYIRYLAWIFCLDQYGLRLLSIRFTPTKIVNMLGIPTDAKQHYSYFVICKVYIFIPHLNQKS